MWTSYWGRAFLSDVMGWLWPRPTSLYSGLLIFDTINKVHLYLEDEGGYFLLWKCESVSDVNGRFLQISKDQYASWCWCSERAPEVHRSLSQKCSSSMLAEEKVGIISRLWFISCPGSVPKLGGWVLLIGSLVWGQSTRQCFLLACWILQHRITYSWSYLDLNMIQAFYSFISSNNLSLELYIWFSIIS